MSESIFPPSAPLRRGPHGLSRAEVAESQRIRLLQAITEITAEHGFGAVTIGHLVARAGVSRNAFYAHFADKQECLLAAYDFYTSRVVTAMTASDPPDWETLVDRVLTEYLLTLTRNPVAARAFVVEMDAAGPEARRRRQEEARAFSGIIARQHRLIQAREPDPVLLPDRVYLGLVLGIRELVNLALVQDPTPDLMEMRDDLVFWARAVLRGASTR